MPVETSKHTVRTSLAMAERAIRRRYARSLHQRVAFDALTELSGPDAARWRQMFHSEAALLALGADAPDQEFRDFKNHVLFPRDGYWGGAIGRAQSWYQNLVAALSKREWNNAAYCAGVLSHYVTDALHPFHTAQSEAENDIHFACDVAVQVDYGNLRTLAVTAAAPIKLADGAGFLAPAIAAGADAANLAYEGLLAHFDLSRAVADPAAGLDAVGRRIMAGVLAAQVQLLAAILNRAILDAASEAPASSLWRSGLTSALMLPLVHRRMRSRLSEARRQIAVMFDEVRANGRAQASVPDEERVKRDQYARDIVATRAPVNIGNVFPLDARRTTVVLRPTAVNTAPVSDDGDDTGGEVVVLQRRRAVIDLPRPAPRWVKPDAVRSRADVLKSSAAQPTVMPIPVASPERATQAAAPATAGVGHAAAAMLLPASTEGLSNFRDRRLQRTEEPGGTIPGVGPVDALILRAAGVVTAERFIAADAGELSSRIGPLPVNADTLRGWQARTRLMLAVPGLAGTEADLLLGSGYATAAAIADADAEKVCADILAFVTTEAGRQALAVGSPPDVAKVRAMVEAARAAQAA